jgi:hypothetical protein
METLLSFPAAHKLCAAIVAVLAAIERILSVPVWLVLSVRFRIEDALENSEQEERR